MTWGKPETDYLTANYGKISASQIMGELARQFSVSVTRSAVIGKATRMKLPGPPRRMKLPGPPRPRSAPRLGPRRQGTRLEVTMPNAPIAALPTTPETDRAIPVAQRKQLLDLRKHDCRWGVGDVGEPSFFFCAAPQQAGSPYCAGHTARAFTGRVR